MKYLKLFAGVFSLLVLVSCGNSTVTTLPTPSGRPGDLLIIIDQDVWKSPGGDTLKNLFQQDIVGLPWEETMFDISHTDHENFIRILHTARSIIDVDVSKTYSQPKVVYQTDLYSRTQRFIKIQLPSVKDLKPVVEKEGMKMLSFIYQGERERFLANYRKFNNPDLMKMVKDSIGVDMIIPSDFTRYSFHDNFVWMLAKSNDYMKYLAIYTYDYKSQSQLTKKNLVAMRDSVMRVNIPGSRPGSYMSTGMFYPPVLTQFMDHGKYVAELRGIWETEGDMMGGPFVSQTRIDEASNRVVTVEVFLYAPHKNKRNTMRELESLLYTVKLSDEEKPQGTQNKEDEE
ncbi:DUF4837 family protein [Saccharicrinis sp. FJH54]|uniref:DUF4837 family protein n=1 Tax=Saccharicrinis sp. FJH54 TaxID=3344665 RepID=UPI0035D4B9E3